VPAFKLIGSFVYSVTPAVVGARIAVVGSRTGSGIGRRLGLGLGRGLSPPLFLFVTPLPRTFTTVLVIGDREAQKGKSDKKLEHHLVCDETKKSRVST
jgi:hypothetical protein